MAAAEEKAEASAPAAMASAAAGGGKLVTILTAVNLVATLGIAAVVFISFQRDKKQPSVADIVAHEGEGEHGKEGGEGGHGEGGGEAKEGGEKGHDSKKPSVEFSKMVSLEQFTVNLSTLGSTSPKFVRVNIAIEVPSADAESEVTQKMPQVRNTIIDLFNSKRASDLSTSEGRDYVKDEIRNALNSFMVSGKVKGVFFTSFAVSG